LLTAVGDVHLFWDMTPHI